MARVLSVAVALVAIIGCASGSEEEARSVFWDSTGDVVGASGERMVYPTRDLAGLVQGADAVVVATVNAEASRELASPFMVDEPVISQGAANAAKLSDSLANTPMSTTSVVGVSRWLSGTGPDTMEVTTHGGFMPDGQPYFLDGTFLLEPGRTYLLALYLDRNGEYVAGSARTGFDLTDGVKVLNHPDTKDLEHLEESSVDEFVAYVDSLLEGKE